MSATRETVMQELLDAASDAMRRKQPGEACQLIAAYETLVRTAVTPGKPYGLDSGSAIQETA